MSQLSQQDQAVADYEAGRWVASGFGNRYTVARKGRKPSEIDQSFKTSVLDDAIAEAARRNLEAGL